MLRILQSADIIHDVMYPENTRAASAYNAKKSMKSKLLQFQTADHDASEPALVFLNLKRDVDNRNERVTKPICYSFGICFDFGFDNWAA